MMQSRVIAQQEQYQQQLWRPSGELLHLLTEGKRQAADLEELHGGGRYQSTEEEPMVCKRQAPAVWRPPIGMKPNCPLAPPVVDEWQLPKQEDPSSSLVGEKRSDDSSDQGNHFLNAGTDSPSDLCNLVGSRTNSSSGNAHPLEVDNGGRNELSTTTEEELMPAPRTGLPDPGKLFQGSPSPFSSNGRRDGDSPGSKLPSPFIKQQAVAQTPLFSGLGSVSFGSGAGFLKPPAANVFAQSPPLAFGRSLRNSPDEEQPRQQQAPPQVSTVKHLSSTNSASEKGSSDSQTGKAGVATESNGGFKPSGLAGKSLVPESPAKAGKRNVSSGRKLRTRPLDLLMNALPSDAPAKATRLSSRISNTSGAQLNASSSAPDAGAGTPNTRNSSASRAPKPTRNPARQESSQKQDQQDRQHQHHQQQQQQQQQRKGAFFVHTGVWIVQKKSSRHARSAFRKKSLDEQEEEGEGEEEEGKRQNQIVPVASHRSRQAPSKTRNGHHPHQNQPGTTTATTTRPTSTKKRSLTAISTPQQPEPKQPRRNQPKAQKAAARDAIKAGRREKRANDEEEEEEEEEDGGKKEEEEEVEDDSLVVTKAPLVRSKRGRPRSLPTKLRDSVVNKVTKKTTK